MNTKLLAAALGLALSLNAQAQGVTATDHAAHHPAAASAALVPASGLADGEVRRIDREQARLTLRHGPIPHLDMPGMTMVFKVADPKLLDGLHEGDKVRFAAESVQGVLTVTALEPATR